MRQYFGIIRRSLWYQVFLATASVHIRVARVVATTVREPAVEPVAEPSIATARPAPQRPMSGADAQQIIRTHVLPAPIGHCRGSHDVVSMS
jgi:hypothetical protein